ncbi:hypothetical protein HN446_00365 [bacterium]|jgi:hypothetical protein|nr:hypothetical protein [bacterium]
MKNVNLIYLSLILLLSSTSKANIFHRKSVQASLAVAATLTVALAGYKIGKAVLKSSLGITTETETPHRDFSEYVKASKRLGRPLFLYTIGARIEGAMDFKDFTMVKRDTGKEDYRYLHKPCDLDRIKK